jgi:cobalt-zinc-cadmium efflux system outer membrane protein
MSNSMISLLLITVSAFAVPPSMADTLTIDMAVTLGMQRHPEIRMAQSEIDAARGEFWENVSPESPIFSFENEEIPSGAGYSDYGQQTIGISQGLEFPLVTYYRGRASGAALESARLGLDIARIFAKNEICLTFVRTWLSKEKLAVADSLADAAERLAQIADRRAQMGDITGLERDRLLVQSQNLKGDRMAAELEYRVALTKLSQIIGNDIAEATILGAPMLAEMNVDPAAPPNRSAILWQSALAEKSARHRLTAEKLSWLPNLEMRIFKQSISGDRFWGGELGISIPIWYPFGGRGRIIGARGNAEQSAALAEKTRRDWNSDWTEAAGSYSLSRQRLRDFEAITLPVSRRAFAAARRGYEVGEIGLTDLLLIFLEEQAVEMDYLDAIAKAWEWRARLEFLGAESFRR